MIKKLYNAVLLIIFMTILYVVRTFLKNRGFAMHESVLFGDSLVLIFLMPFYVEYHYHEMGLKDRIHIIFRSIISFMFAAVSCFAFFVFGNKLVEESKNFHRYTEFMRVEFWLIIVIIFGGMYVSVKTIDALTKISKKWEERDLED